MVAAASISGSAIKKINSILKIQGYNLRCRIDDFIKKMKQPDLLTSYEAQAQFALLKLHFNNILDQLDIFSDVMSQRTEFQTGVLIAGLDILAEDALNIPIPLYDVPPVVCFPERGHGAAIRKARTKLPGGISNPVAVIQIPRERLVGSGIAASIIHEVGHQGSTELGLKESIGNEIEQLMQHNMDAAHRQAWDYYKRCLSEILSDFWAMAHLGICATTGLMAVMSLPEIFLFKVNREDPHPFPWFRVMLSIAFGAYLYPDKQWNDIKQLWHSLYDTTHIPDTHKAFTDTLLALAAPFVTLVCNHQSESLKGHKLLDIFEHSGRSPQQLQQYLETWRQSPQLIFKAAPSLVFAVIGQAKWDHKISVKQECTILTKLLKHWALQRAEHN
ncbi:hypothetical protein DBR32_00540 [Taibaiella sp. KBW10]|nr:hypothetical protein DBR32_00540 [Taibaiella sp. KBW10]